jgi:hypothetical protein
VENVNAEEEGKCGCMTSEGFEGEGVESVDAEEERRVWMTSEGFEGEGVEIVDAEEERTSEGFEWTF